MISRRRSKIAHFRESGNKQRLTLTVEVLDCIGELMPWADRGQAAMMAFSYTDPRSGERVAVEQAVRGVTDPATWNPRRGAAELLCWGVMAGGLLRHPVFVQWRG